MRQAFAIAAALLLPIALTGCKRQVSNKPIGTPVQIHVPLGLPALPIPANNPPTAETIALGRRLFYDKHVSVDNTLSCASCHDPRAYFTDGKNVSTGVRGALGVRNAPTILNAAYLPFQFWDGRAITLEEQAAFPIANPVEMSQPHAADVSKLGNDPQYRSMFKSAFGTDDVNIERVEAALASFERTALTGNSAFDRFQYGSDKTSLTPAQLRGFMVYLDATRGNCAACHTVGAHDALFTDGKFHNTGQGVNDSGSFSDVGRFHETKIATDTGAFKTPTLRNIAGTAPYMHDGSLKTLKAVVDFYAGGGNSNPYLDPEMKKIHLSGQDRADLVEFLQSLTGDVSPNLGPPEK
ncbi:cytochrome-c peroxidase [Terriglobus roseus]|uniref:Cytochrome c peroxidase n=1 Tax=Terriglobus roseus TaxID=392734 RepID=A0A1H4KH40_9BACT|nr:cytochrome c peroxidase [Terriglobus roseus]SEB57874.1 cytochrome c peroxidase [Terriglobus roseus]